MDSLSDANSRLTHLVSALTEEDEMKRLSRSLDLGERLHFVVLTCKTPLQGKAAVTVFGQMGFPVTHLMPKQTFGYTFENLTSWLLTPLLDWPENETGKRLFVLDASSATHEEAEAWLPFFARMNLLRNNLMDRLPGPLLLLVTPALRMMFRERASDFWSIRSTEGFASALPELPDFLGRTPGRYIFETPDLNRLNDLVEYLEESRCRYEETPQNAGALRGYLYALNNFGQEVPTPEEAMPSFDKAEKILSSLMGHEPVETELQIIHAVILSNKADVFFRRDQPQKAETCYRASIDLFRKTMKEHHQNPLWWAQSFVDTLLTFGRMQQDAAFFEECLEYLKQEIIHRPNKRE